MRNMGFAVFIVLLIGLAPAGQVALAMQADAAPVAPAIQPDAYSELYDVIKSGVDEERVLDQLIASFSQQLATANPDLVQAEAAFPGFSSAIGVAMRPMFKSYRARLQGIYRPRMIAEFKRMLNESEARDAVDVYRSPIGRKILAGVTAGYDGKATMASALRGNGDEIEAAAVLADRDIAVNRAVNGLSPADLAELERMARQKPVMFKLGRIGSKMREMSVAMENEPLTPSEEAEMGRLIDAAAKAHVAKFSK